MNNRYYFVRHGETHYNAEKIIMGTLQIPLNEKGIEYAYKLKKDVCEYSIDLIFCSPLLRAIQTLNILDINREIITDSRLSERCYGELQGQRKDSYFINYPQYENKDILRNFYEKPNGGESINQVFERVFDFIHEVERNNNDKNILIVTHNGVLRAVHNYFLDIPIDDVLKMKFPHCKLITFSSKK